MYFFCKPTILMYRKWKVIELSNIKFKSYITALQREQGRGRRNVNLENNTIFRLSKIVLFHFFSPLPPTLRPYITNRHHQNSFCRIFFLIVFSN